MTGKGIVMSETDEIREDDSWDMDEESPEAPYIEGYGTHSHENHDGMGGCLLVTLVAFAVISAIAVLVVNLA